MTLDVDIQLQQGDFRLAARFVAPDGITVLFGPSGSGKTTLLSAVAGLKPCKGHIRLGARTLTDSDARRHVPAHRRGIGLVFQDARLFPHLSVRQNLLYAQRRAPRERRADIAQVADFFDIAFLLDRSVSALSGGEKSRAALARAIVSAPDYLLLDEPFAALDGTRRRNFMRILLNMHQAYGLAMLIVTHDIDDAAALGSHLVALAAGAVVATGPFAQATRLPAFGALLDARDCGAAVPAHLLHKAQGDSGQALWLRADHVLLATQKPAAISARNVLEGIVRAVWHEDAGSHLVELQTDAGTITARLTAEAVQELDIASGKKAWALVKAHLL